jgi:hypothetical protein
MAKLRMARRTAEPKWNMQVEVFTLVGSLRAKGPGSMKFVDDEDHSDGDAYDGD